MVLSQVHCQSHHVLDLLSLQSIIISNIIKSVQIILLKSIVISFVDRISNMNVHLVYREMEQCVQVLINNSLFSALFWRSGPQLNLNSSLFRGWLLC